MRRQDLSARHRNFAIIVCVLWAVHWFSPSLMLAMTTCLLAWHVAQTEDETARLSQAVVALEERLKRGDEKPGLISNGKTLSDFIR